MEKDPLSAPAFELASRQASLAFERTLIGLDQLLMSSIRTSLSLLTFGFAMVLFFHHVSGEVGVNLRVPARNFGLTLAALGVGLLASGLAGHRARFNALRAQMDELHQRKLLVECCPRMRTPIAILAVALLVSGLLVMAGILIRMGPFA